LGAKWNKFTLTYHIDNVSTHLTPAQRESIIQQAFQAWDAVSILSFTQVSSASAADIKLKWVIGSHGDGHDFDGPNGVLAHITEPPSSGIFTSCEIHFDDAENWTTGATGGSSYRLLSTAMHEIGHALGLAHTNSNQTIMYENYTGLTTLSSDDIQGIQSLYYASITGSAGVCSSTTYTASVSAPYTWNKSSNLTLTSTSGNTATFSSNGNGVGWISIMVNGTEVTRKDIYTGTPPAITTISGPGSATSGASGSSAYFEYTASPSLSATNCSYVWSTVPSTTLIDPPYFNSVYIRFQAPGSYTVRCHSLSPCGIATSDALKYVSVTSAVSYSVAQGASSKAFVVTASNSGDNIMSSAGNSVAYLLFRQSTGAVAATGQIPSQGGTLDFSNLPAGIYILQIHVNDELIDTHRILLK
jgi:hypothetical protein